MKKSILTIGAIALNAVLLASCNSAKDYSVKREDVKELSKEEVNETLASRPEGFEELYKVYSDNNIVSLKDTLTYEAEGMKVESSLIYDFETASVYITFSSSREDYKYNYSFNAYLEDNKYLYGLDLHVENYPIMGYKKEDVAGIGTMTVPYVDHTKSGDAKIKGEANYDSLLWDNYVCGLVTNISLAKDVAFQVGVGVKVYATEDKLYYWSEASLDNPANYHEIGVCENNLVRYNLVETNSYKKEMKLEYFEKNQLDGMNKDFSAYEESFSINNISVVQLFTMGLLNLDSLVEAYMD